MTQTAVEWLNRQIRLNSKIKENSKDAISFTLGLSKFDELFEQAKEMEKEQLCYFYIKGVEGEMSNPYITNIEFYNETFKSEQ